ncbi:MAG: alcohol dehydrogenase catalytic domain-containing protein [Rubrobacter sp.]|nr:alcohol dehydrogenase catalytic domain-containing protein [Rubrobacter sp.]
MRVDEVPIPVPQPHQALIEVEWCGICGTDLEEYRDGPVNIPLETHSLTGRKAPIALGHEIVGRVVESARDGSGPRAGDRVIPDVVLGCGECWWCRRHQEGLCVRSAVVGLHADGGLSEYVAAEAATCVPVPLSLRADVAALAEPASVAVRALRKVPSPIGSSLLVIGAGTIGLLVVQVARSSGVRKVMAVDPEARRRELALALGADAAFDPAELEALSAETTEGIGPDTVIECSGVPGTAREAMRLVRRGGTTVLVGLHGREESFDLLDTVLGEKRVVGSAAHLWDEDVVTAVTMLARGDIDGDPLLTTYLSLDQVAKGFDALEAPLANAALKVLVTPHQAYLQATSGSTTP